jgi:hypothetical protein
MIVALYGLLGDRVPAIMWVHQWSTWVFKGDLPVHEFPSLQAYLDEFPYQVEVTADCVVVTDPGFGNGAITWTLRSYTLSDGTPLVTLIELDEHVESSECNIWIGQYHEGHWLDLTDFVLPGISRADFFGKDIPPTVLEDYELAALKYTVPRVGDELYIHAVPNVAFECRDGKVMHEDVTPELGYAICQAWASFRSAPYVCRFDPVAGKFVLQ